MSPAAQEHNNHFKHLLDLLSDWYWEQDEDYRFTLLTGAGLQKAGIDPQPLIGKTGWDHGEVPLGDDGKWDAHKAVLGARQPFTDFTFRTARKNGKLHYISVSGQPAFDRDGKFLGYRGIGKDVTRQVQLEIRRTIEHDVTRILVNSNSAADAVPAIIETICGTMRWRCGARWIVDDTKNIIRQSETWGIATPEIDTFLRSGADAIPMAERTPDLIRDAVLDGKPVWVRDAGSEPTFRRRAEAAAAGLHSAFAFPLRSGQDVIGVLAFFSPEIHQPDPNLLDAATYIGDRISQFILLTQAREKLLQSEERFRNLTELSSDWLWEQDDEGRITFLDGPFEEKTGLKADMQLGKPPWAIPALNLTQNDWDAHKAQLQQHQPFFDLEIRRPDLDGQPRWMSISGRPVFDPTGRFIGYRGVGKDITARKQHEERIRYLATHDGLTGLPNRALFGEILQRTLQTSLRYNRKFALLFVGLDRFKLINDTLGHDAGDVLLKEVGTRLTQCMRNSDIVARLGGDEFVVLAQEVQESRHAAKIADKILCTIVKPLMLANQEVRATASIGICIYPSNAQDAASLMRCGDVTMHRAKQEGKNTYQFYSPQIKSESQERLALESSLRKAVELEQFFLHFQPTVDLRTRIISGAEALVRWRHPDRGIVAPLDFIPLAEETGLIVPIGRWVLNHACMHNVAWQKEGLPPARIAVNLSARQFNDDSLLDDIAGALQRSGMDPTLLELELTESMVIQNAERAGKLLAEIKRLGVRVAIDDFGTGYSSLAQLKRFPIDTLKIDRSFIRDLPHNTEDRAITEAIVAMGRTLNLMVVAEGVETGDQESFLRECGCHEMQGYYFSKPVAPADYAELLRERQMN